MTNVKFQKVSKQEFSVQSSDEHNYDDTESSDETKNPWNVELIGVFFLLGLLQKSIFVIFNSIAEDIDPDNVGMVYFFNSVPSVILGFINPYVCIYIRYDIRFSTAAILFSIALISVAHFHHISVRLIAIAFSATASSIGEPAILSLTSLFGKDTPSLLGAVSSGSGFAGIFGYTWTLFFESVLRFSTPVSLSVAALLPSFWLHVYYSYVRKAASEKLKANASDEEDQPLVERLGDDEYGDEYMARQKFSMKQKLSCFLSLWKFMIPLFIVYAAEYAMQSGVWAAIGFPFDSAESREYFYLRANLLYQFGVFVSRSSALFFTISMATIWILPFLQTFLLLFFFWNAQFKQMLWSEEFNFFLSFVAGLFGGAVYVNTYIKLSGLDFSSSKLKQFALASVGVSGTLGIITGDISGLLIQSCIYGFNGIRQVETIPVFTCGYNFTIST